MSDARHARILACTVGGSHQPVLRALREGEWDHVLFVCTPGGYDSRPAGSAAAVREAVRDEHRRTESVTVLPPLPAQAGLPAERWELLEVPPDDPDAAFGRLCDRLAELRRRFPEAEIRADFTGGTKSMSAALVLAALRDPAIRLQVTTGERSNLVRVADGTEQGRALDLRRVVLERQAELLAAAWQKHGYQEAAAGFETLWRGYKDEPGAAPALTARLRRWWQLSDGFAAWDRFDHGSARHCLKSGRLDQAPGGDALLQAATALARRKQGDPSALALVDMWNNAERRAVRGRFDDAVARCYRLWEWAAQWLLWADHGIRTGKVPVGRLPERHRRTAAPDAEGNCKIGLMQAWDLLTEEAPGTAAGQFWAGAGSRAIRAPAERRNLSILAHGEQAVTPEHWTAVRDFTQSLLEVVRAEATRLGEPAEVPQLPVALPGSTSL